MLRHLFLCLVLLSAPDGVQAQPIASPQSPEEVCLDLKRLATRSPAQFAKKMHPEALALFKDLILEYIQSTPAEDRSAVVGTLFDETIHEEQIEATSASKLFASFHHRLWSNMPPEMVEAMNKAELTVVGSIPENDIAHVVIRTSFKDSDYRKLDVVSFKMHGNSWLAMMGEELEFRLRNIIRKNAE